MHNITSRYKEQVKPIFHQKMRLHLLPNANEIDTNNARGPNATYIPPAHVGPVFGPWGLALGHRCFALGPRGFALGL